MVAEVKACMAIIRDIDQRLQRHIDDLKGTQIKRRGLWMAEAETHNTHI